MSAEGYGNVRGFRQGRGGSNYRRGRRGGSHMAPPKPNHEEIAATIREEFPQQSVIVEAVLRDHKGKPLEQVRRLVKDQIYGMIPVMRPEYEGLREDYRSYLEHFEVSFCPGNCTGVDCIYFHKGRVVLARRKPARLSNGIWQYLPIVCLEEGCSDANCAFAHCQSEVLYHPMTYKTKPCAYQLTAKDTCTKYAYHCPFIHPQLDDNGLPGFPYNRLNPSEPLPVLPTLPAQIEYNEQMRHFSDTFVNLTDTRKNKISEMKVNETDNDAAFARETYKIHPCVRFACKRDEKCVDYHSLWEKRRANDGLYAQQPCGYVYNEGEKRFFEANRCPQGDECQYSHTENEVFYHRFFFRKKPCLNFLQLSSCPHPYCPFLHERNGNSRMPAPVSLPILPIPPLPQPAIPPQPDINSALSAKAQSVQATISHLTQEIQQAEAELRALEAAALCTACKHQDFLYVLLCGHTLCSSCAEEGRKLKLNCCRKCGKVSKTLVRLAE